MDTLAQLQHAQVAVWLLFSLLLAAILIALNPPECENPGCRAHHREHRAHEKQTRITEEWKRNHAWHDPQIPYPNCPFCRVR